MFRVGQKVVCIKKTMGDGGIVASDLTIGAVYTVALTDHFPPFGQGIDLVELPAAHQSNYNPVLVRPFYFSGLFRPAVEKKTDISIFTAMLNPANHRVDA